MAIVQVKFYQIDRINEILSIFQAPDNCTCATGWTGNICEIGKYSVVNSLII